MLLDVEMRDPAAMAYFREQIADVAAVPVLDLREAIVQAAPEPDRPVTREPAGVRIEAKAARRGLRVPWQRRPRRPAQPSAEPEPVPAAGCSRSRRSRLVGCCARNG